MNKIKIMLSAVAVIAIVGGSLAFKASKFSRANVYCSTFGQQQNLCDKVNFTTDNEISSSDNPCSGGLFYTASDCPSTTVFTTVSDGGAHTVQKVKSQAE